MAAFRVSSAVLAVTVGLSPLALADETPAAEPGEAWKSSPFHGVIDPSTGLPIPCLCLFKGQKFKLGEAVCMNTHVGTVIARCDLLYNNTTWVPTTQSCTISRASVSQSLAEPG